MDGEAPGNFGLMDQSAALLWCQRNIELFGGNRELVTLMGHGAGAVAVSLHLTSGEWSAELFQRAIIMSGSSLTPLAVRDPDWYSGALDQLAIVFGCFRRPTALLLSCLRRVDAQLLIEGSPLIDWGPIVDEGLSNVTMAFVASDPRTLIERQQQQRKVPLLIGFTSMEDSLDVSAMGELLDSGVTSDMYDVLVGDIILNELSALEAANDTCGGNMQAVLDALNFVYKPYPPVTDPLMLRDKFIEFSTERNYASPSILLAMHMSRAGGGGGGQPAAAAASTETYVYRFDIRPKTMSAMDGLPTWGGVPHRYELIFVWGLPYWVQLENQTQWDSADKRVADIIMTLWSNFAKYGEPTKLGVYIKWDPFTVEQQGVLIIDRSFNMSDSSTINYQAVNFWNDYYPKVVAFASQCCNGTDNGGESTTVRRHRSDLVLMSIVLVVVSQLIIYSKA